MDRCYSNGLPDGDEIPHALMENLKVPSYKAIAICILNNDLRLRRLGFPNDASQLVRSIEAMKERNNSENLDLF